MTTATFESNITEVDKINPFFSKVKINIAYSGINRNGSYISKETFEKAIPSIYNCPIIGEYNESINDFRGHGGKIEIVDDTIKYIQTTQPYGVIDADSEITWEYVDDKEYLCATGYLWTGRYPELESVIQNSKSQSMEIDIVNGKTSTIDDKKVYEISDFCFSAFCILGDDVEPAFENSQIMAYSLNKDDFKSQFSLMLKELKQSMFESNKDEISFSLEGGNEMAKKDKVEDTKNEEEVKQEEVDNKEEMECKDKMESEEDFKCGDKEKMEAEKEDSTEKFALTSEQLEEELERELAEIEVITEEYWGEVYQYPRYSFVDYISEQSVVISYDCKERFIVGFNYSVVKDNVEVDGESVKRYLVSYVPMDLSSDNDDEEFSFIPNKVLEYKLKVKEAELSHQFSVEKEEIVKEKEAIQTNFSVLESEVAELREFKSGKLSKERLDSENELFEKFTEIGLTEEDMKSVKEEKEQFSLEQIEEKLFSIHGRKNAQAKFSVEKKDKSLRLDIPIETKKKSSDKIWADLFE